MKVTIKIQCDNEAFSDDPGIEVSRILRELADKMENGSFMDYPCYDVNGNRVGDLKIGK